MMVQGGLGGAAPESVGPGGGGGSPPENFSHFNFERVKEWKSGQKHGISAATGTVLSSTHHT